MHVKNLGGASEGESDRMERKYEKGLTCFSYVFSMGFFCLVEMEMGEREGSPRVSCVSPIVCLCMGLYRRNERVFWGEIGI